MNDRTKDRKSLPPWKAFVGIVVCCGMAILFYRIEAWPGACAMSGLTGMFLQDWAYRLRDKHDPGRLL
jgi:hypothetical protein